MVRFLATFFVVAGRRLGPLVVALRVGGFFLFAALPVAAESGFFFAVLADAFFGDRVAVCCFDDLVVAGLALAKFLTPFADLDFVVFLALDLADAVFLDAFLAALCLPPPKTWSQFSEYCGVEPTRVMLMAVGQLFVVRGQLLIITGQAPSSAATDNQQRTTDQVQLFCNFL